ncbi:MAG: DUF507 family protein [Acidobacteriota bacterium]|jgi:hypothetical protein|nr:DUF507 family protein [Bryobacteraceae bacterium CoA2 C42]
MLLPKELIEYLSRQLIKRLNPLYVEVGDPAKGALVVSDLIVQELSTEDRLNDEVRGILEQYANYMRENQISYADMFRKIKNQLIAERKVIRASGRDTGDAMKLSRDKITDISHKVIAAFRKSREFRLKKPENDIRLEIVKGFTELLLAEDKIDKAAREKVRKQKREILEGSEEFELLQRRYYAEELKKIGIELSRP